MAKAAELDTELVSGLKIAKSKRTYFALVLKGSNDGALILSKTKVPPTAIAQAKKQSGGSAVLKGFCQFEDGKYVFETAKDAPATAAQAVKVIVKRDAGMAISALFRVGADAELLEGEEGAESAVPPQAPPASPAAEGADLLKRLNGMTAAIKAALAGPNKAQVQSLFVAANGQIKSKAFADATKSLDELQKLLAQPPATPAQPDGADLLKRLNGMTADIKVALAGPNKAQVQALFVAANGQIKSKDLVQAGKTLDQLDALLEQAASSGAASPAESDAQQAEWERRVAALEPKILEAQKSRPAEAKWMTLFMAAQDYGSAGDFAKSFTVLDRLQALLDAPPKAAPSVSPDSAAGRWDAVRAAAVAKLTNEIKIVAAIDHPDKGQAELQLKAVLAQISGEMTNQKHAAEMERYLQADDVVADICDMAFDVKTPLLKVLSEIKSQLQA